MKHLMEKYVGYDSFWNLQIIKNSTNCYRAMGRVKVAQNSAALPEAPAQTDVVQFAAEVFGIQFVE